MTKGQQGQGQKSAAPAAEQPPPAAAPEKPREKTEAEKRQQLIEETGLAFRNFLSQRADLIKRMVRKGSKLDEMLLVRCAELVYRSKEVEKLLDPRCWPSVLTALMTAAQLDLEPGGALGEAHLVPYWDNTLRINLWSLMPGYRGLIKLAAQSGAVKRIRAFVVYDKDDFVYEQGSDERIIHRPYLDEDRGKERGVYAIARMSDGDDEYEWVPWADVMKIRKQAYDKSPAWANWPDQMARKSAIKRISKQLPAGANFAFAVELDHAAEQGDTAKLRSILAAAGVEVDGYNRGQLAAPQKSAADQVLDNISNGNKRPGAAEVLASKLAVPVGAKDVTPSKAATEAPKRSGWPDDASDDVPDWGRKEPTCERCAAPVEKVGDLCEACANE